MSHSDTSIAQLLESEHIRCMFENYVELLERDAPYLQYEFENLLSSSWQNLVCAYSVQKKHGPIDNVKVLIRGACKRYIDAIQAVSSFRCPSISTVDEDEHFLNFVSLSKQMHSLLIRALKEHDMIILLPAPCRKVLKLQSSCVEIRQMSQNMARSSAKQRNLKKACNSIAKPATCTTKIGDKTPILRIPLKVRSAACIALKKDASLSSSSAIPAAANNAKSSQPSSGTMQFGSKADQSDDSWLADKICGFCL